jgi:hypothetical protein
MPLNPIEGVSFSLSSLEAKAIFAMISMEGFPGNGQGVKAFLISLALEEDKDENEEDEKEGELSEVVRKILEVAERNPHVTEQAIKKGGQILSSLVDKLTKKN